MASVGLHHVTVTSGRAARRGPPPSVILDDISLEVDDGEMVAIVGPSGSGKTTMLRTVAGLQTPSRGSVNIGGVDVTDRSTATRDVSMVFQNPALLPNRNVARNVAFPLEVRATDRDEIHIRVLAEARALHIEALLRRSPTQLSAGERQLVQVARALVRVPSVLLLDEPLARLDARSRERMRAELRVLQRGYGVTTLMATNDPSEAMSMPHRLVVLDAGRILQVGVPLDVHREPVNLLAAVLTGDLAVTTVGVAADTEGFWLDHGRGRERERAWRPSLAAYVGHSVTRGERRDGSVLFFDPWTGARLA